MSTKPPQTSSASAQPRQPRAFGPFGNPVLSTLGLLLFLGLTPSLMQGVYGPWGGGGVATLSVLGLWVWGILFPVTVTFNGNAEETLHPAQENGELDNHARKSFLKSQLFLIPAALTIPLAQLEEANGWAIGLRVWGQATGCWLVVARLVYSTSIERIFFELRRLGVPRLLVTLMAAMHRYQFVMREELHRMTRARAARTYRSNRWYAPAEILAWGNLPGMLLIRARRRSERVEAAMLARGFRGDFPDEGETLYQESP